MVVGLNYYGCLITLYDLLFDQSFVFLCLLFDLFSMLERTGIGCHSKQFYTKLL